MEQTSSPDAEKFVRPHMAQWRRRWTFLEIRITLVIVLTHLLCIIAPFHFTWPAFGAAVFTYVAVGLLGITLSYHRLLAHRSFKLPKCLEYLFAYCGVFAFQGDPINWVSIHRHHHQYVETDRDPHSPIEGFWFSHMAWFMNSYTLTKKFYPEYVEDFQKKQSNIFEGNFNYGKPNNVKDLEDQIFYRFIQNTYWLHPLVFGIALYVVGGLPFLSWTLGVVVTWGYHVTFMVNSVCHVWGTQPWNTHDLSKNNWLVALMTFGEGWHNNHHAFEYSAKQGLEWWQLDFTWYAIRLLQVVGLATHVKLPSQHHKLAKSFKSA